MRTVLAWLSAAVAGAVVLGCGFDGPADTAPQPSASPPCGGSPASTARLGGPLVSAEEIPRTTRFITTGGPLHVSASEFRRDYVGDIGGRMLTELTIGRVDASTSSPRPPVRFGQGTFPAGAIKVRVREDEYVEFQVPAGEYWLIATNLITVHLYSCTPDAVSGIPAKPLKNSPPPASPTPTPS